MLLPDSMSNVDKRKEETGCRIGPTGEQWECMLLMELLDGIHDEVGITLMYGLYSNHDSGSSGIFSTDSGTVAYLCSKVPYD